MKKLIAFLVFLYATSLGYSQPSYPLQREPEVEITLSSDELLSTWGWILARKYYFNEYGFKAVDVEEIAKGMRAFLADEPPPADIRALALMLGEDPRAYGKHFTKGQDFSSVNSSMLATWGWLRAREFDFTGFEIADWELDVITTGMVEYTESDGEKEGLEDSLAQINAYFDKRKAEIDLRKIEEGRIAEQDYFDSLVGEPGYFSTMSGLYYEILEEGSKEKPKSNDRVRCHYRGTLLDGTEFDSSHSKGQPAEFQLDRVIQGWTQGVPMIGVGGKIRLHIPAKLGYGDVGQPGIPPASTLIFEIELLEILEPLPAPDPRALPPPPGNFQ